MDNSIGFTFDCEASEPEIVMLESHYNLMRKDLEDMEGEIDQLHTIIAMLVDVLNKEEIEFCICSDCILEYTDKHMGIN